MWKKNIMINNKETRKGRLEDLKNPNYPGHDETDYVRWTWVNQEKGSRCPFIEIELRRRSRRLRRQSRQVLYEIEGVDFLLPYFVEAQNVIRYMYIKKYISKNEYRVVPSTK